METKHGENMVKALWHTTCNKNMALHPFPALYTPLQCYCKPPKQGRLENKTISVDVHKDDTKSEEKDLSTKEGGS